jgi:6-phosphogluconolactonase
MAQLTIANDDVDLAQRAAERLTRLIEQAVSASGRALVSLTGGTTPRRLYATLADPTQAWSSRIPWSQVHLFWGDERHVPPEHPDSNYGMAKASLTDHVPVRLDHVHRIRAELPDPRAAAADYEQTLDDLAVAFSGKKNPLFDVMLLGVGEDGHIASIFPGSELLAQRSDNPIRRRVSAVQTPRGDAWRITLTPDSILDAGAIVVLVAGANKAAAVQAARDAPLDLNRYPVQLLRAAGNRVEWFLDRAAASLISTTRAASAPRPG